MLHDEVEKQISQCIWLLNDIFGSALLGIYLYGSSVLGGLQKYSDIDLFVVLSRPTIPKEKAKLAAELLKISGIYMKSNKPPIEMTIVEKSAINPWHYPPYFDFQYGDWLRKEFESGHIEPWGTKEMPDLALLITQVLLANKVLQGPSADRLLCKIPYQDFILAIIHTLKTLMSDIDHDTRNVLLTYARIWNTVETDTICSKPAAADWVVDRLPDQYRSVMQKAKTIYMGKEKEYWEDIQSLIQPCAAYVESQINQQIARINVSDNKYRTIELAEN